MPKSPNYRIGFQNDEIFFLLSYSLYFFSLLFCSIILFLFYSVLFCLPPTLIPEGCRTMTCSALSRVAFRQLPQNQQNFPLQKKT